MSHVRVVLATAIALGCAGSKAAEADAQSNLSLSPQIMAGAFPSPFASGCGSGLAFGYGGSLGLGRSFTRSAAMQVTGSVIVPGPEVCPLVLESGPQRRYDADVQKDALVTADLRVTKFMPGEIFDFEASIGPGLTLGDAPTPFAVIAVGMRKGPVVLGLEARTYWIKHTWEIWTGATHEKIGEGRKPITGLMVTAAVPFRIH